MKKLMLLAALLMLVAIAGYAQTVQFTSHFGFSMATNVAGSLVWTNDTAYSFKFDSMTFNSSVANTTVVQRVHPYRIDQIRGWVVTTNAMAEVESNFYAQVTNTITTYSTNVILSVTNAGSDVYTSDEIKQLFIHSGDIVRWSFSDTSTNTLLYNTTR